MKKYTFENLQTAIANPTAILGEVRAVGVKINRWYHKKWCENDGIQVAEKDWDTLIILDGCRYDLFEETNNINGELTAVKSRGSTSVEFLNENFGESIHHDTVYVSANPYTYKIDPDTFHDTWDLLETDWNEDEETVLPGDVVKRSLEAHKQKPHKRLIIHFMQPHYPFIGKLGENIKHRGYTNKQSEQRRSSGYTVWGKLQYNLNGLTEESVWDAYRENLQIALEKVEHLVEKLDGKTVITADHGNLIGERLSPVPVKGYGHPGYLRIDELIQVPWLELEHTSRRKIVSEPPVKDCSNIKINKEKLKALGYIG